MTEEYLGIALQLLRYTVKRAYASTICANNWAEGIQEFTKEMRTVVPGDYVVELTSHPHRHEAVGRLISCRSEKYYCEDPEDRGDDPEISNDLVWYLELFDGRLFRWRNAAFIRIPKEAVRCCFAGDDPAQWAKDWASDAKRRHDLDALAAEHLHYPVLPIDSQEVAPHAGF